MLQDHPMHMRLCLFSATHYNFKVPTFPVYTINAWNSLSPELVSVQSSTGFKHALSKAWCHY